MYYMGGNYEQTDITSYIINIPNSKEEKEDVTTTANINNKNNKVSSLKLTGMKLRIGAAISQDGVTWGRIEGDDPSGACMVPYDKCDINNDDVSIAINEVTKREYVIHEELYCGWPEVVVNNNPPTSSSAASDTTKTRLDNYYMYYSTMLKESKQKVLACAISNNGFAFSKMGIILAPTTTTDTAATTDDDSNNYDTTLDGGGCMRCNVINRRAVMMNDDNDDDSIRWVKKNKKDADDAPSQWIMYYEGVSTVDGKHRILMAESDNLKEWKKIGLALDVGSSSRSNSDDNDNDDAITTTAWDSKGVGSPHVIRLDDGTYRMYYTGEGMDGSTAIGVARSMDLQIWNRERVVELSSLLMI